MKPPGPGSTPPRHPLWLWPLVALGALARLAACWPERVVRWDEPAYLWLARELLSGRYEIAGYPNLHYPPFLPVLFAPLVAWLPPAWPGNLWFIVAGALLPVPVFQLARRMLGPRVASLTAVLTATFPLLLVSPLFWGTLSEPPYLLLLFVGLDRAHAAHVDGRWRDFVWAGLSLTLAYLTRPEGFLAVGLVFAFLALATVFPQRFTSRAAWPGLAAFAATALLVALPYLVFLHQASGHWMLTGKTGITLELWEGVIEKSPAKYDRAIARLDSRGQELLWYSPERFTLPGLGDLALRDPLELGRRLAANLWALVSGLFGRWWMLVPVALAAGLGLLAELRRGRASDQLFVALQLLPSLAFVAVHIQVRFFAPTVPILLIWTASAAIAWGDRLAERLGSRRWLLGATTVVLTGSLALAPVLFVQGRRSLDFTVPEVGRWLAAHTPASAIVMTRELGVPLYAGHSFCPSPNAPLDEILAYARRRGATHWQVDERELTVVRPHLAFLLEASTRPAGLELVFETVGRHGRALVFALPQAP
jgi:hypothetical protein